MNELEKRLMSLEERVSLLEGTESPSRKTNKAVSPREFLNSYSTSTDVEKVLLLGLYIETHLSQDSFNVDDLRKLFSLSKLKAPLNINDKINLNIKKGFIMEASEKRESKKAWALTGNGEVATESMVKSVG